MKFLIFTSMLLGLIQPTAFAAAVKTPAQFLQKPFYLGDNETNLLKEQLTHQKVTAETFTVTMRCNRYKRTPSSKSRSLNCLAYLVEPETPTAKH